MLILLRGGGDLASGVALRLFRIGLPLIITELAQPLAVRRKVAFAEAIYAGEIAVEGVLARRAEKPAEALRILGEGCIPVMVDPEARLLDLLKPQVLVDGRMTKQPPELGIQSAPLVIGLGPGFVAGKNCHVVVETNRGHFMGRAIWQGAPEPDSGIPEGVNLRRAERVLRAPVGGVLHGIARIGDCLEADQPLAEVDGVVVRAPFKGMLRGLIHPGIRVRPGMKIGDLDPRNDPRYCALVSDKSLAIGGGVVEAILSRVDLRPALWR